jgi:rubrerythrin
MKYNQLKRRIFIMATFTCEKCGATVDCRCKPKKCQNCGETDTIVKTSPPAKDAKEKK